MSKKSYDENDINLESLSEIKIEDSLRAYLPSFMVRRLYDLDSLNEMLTNQNYEDINYLAHKLKGNGASYGHRKITELAIQMQESIELKDYDTLKLLIDNFGVYLKRFLK